MHETPTYSTATIKSILHHRDENELKSLLLVISQEAHLYPKDEYHEMQLVILHTLYQIRNAVTNTNRMVGV